MAMIGGTGTELMQGESPAEPSEDSTSLEEESIVPYVSRSGKRLNFPKKWLGARVTRVTGNYFNVSFYCNGPVSAYPGANTGLSTVVEGVEGVAKTFDDFGMESDKAVYRVGFIEDNLYFRSKVLHAQQRISEARENSGPSLESIEATAGARNRALSGC